MISPVLSSKPLSLHKKPYFHLISLYENFLETHSKSLSKPFYYVYIWPNSWQLLIILEEMIMYNKWNTMDLLCHCINFSFKFLPSQAIHIPMRIIFQSLLPPQFFQRVPLQEDSGFFMVHPKLGRSCAD